ncbi:hypothetical protein O181_070634 [Austropuccinia psidii MF-1]|uniref:Uncharacterized protein n=1 Tax=Austropuccinia psidii MF-1 TaxID=1389203 RepID=A0A9Q3I9P6_9BASI|nr:hypothetical protein [Austropuccinia psidii MF-1]
MIQKAQEIVSNSHCKPAHRDVLRKWIEEYEAQQPEAQRQMQKIRRHSHEISIPLRTKYFIREASILLPQPILMKAPNQDVESNIIKKHRLPQQPQHLQLILSTNISTFPHTTLSFKKW